MYVCVCLCRYVCVNMHWEELWEGSPPPHPALLCVFSLSDSFDHKVRIDPGSSMKTYHSPTLRELLTSNIHEAFYDKFDRFEFYLYPHFIGRRLETWREVTFQRS